MKLACGAGVTRTPVTNEQMSFMDIRRRAWRSVLVDCCGFLPFHFWHWSFGSFSFPLLTSSSRFLDTPYG